MKREDLIHQIVDRDINGLPMTEAEVQSGNRDLHTLACDEFGSWQVALEYAGVSRRTLATSGQFTPERTKTQLRRLCTTGYDLGARVNRSRNRPLYDAAIQHFGSWRSALAAAGINLSNVSRHRPKHFDREPMILWLKHRQAAGKSLAYGEACLENRDKAIAIKRTFGSWAAALREGVPEARLRQWAIDVDKLASLLADAVSGSHADVLVPGVAWKLGSLDIGDDSFDVVFVRPGEQPVSGVWSQLSTRMVPARTVVLSPGEIQDRPDDLAVVFTLDAVFELTEGGAAFQAKRVRSAITAQSTDVGNVFKLRGEFWQLTFAGETKHLKDSVGMKYIARLLSEPHKDIPAVTLQSLQSGIDPLVMTGSSGELLDEQARQEYGQRLRDLQEEFRKARENDDLAKIEALELEMDQLTDAVTEATGLGGRSRQKTDIEKVRKSVREAISRDMRRIGKKHEALGNHLTTFIDTGLTCRYIPEPLVEWVT